MADRWTEVLARALSRHDARMSDLHSREISIQERIENSLGNLKSVGESRRKEIERYNQEVERIASWKNDPVVYIRNYAQTNLRVFHGSLACGWANPGRVRGVLLGEARAIGLEPCISCGYLALSGPSHDAAA